MVKQRLSKSQADLKMSLWQVEAEDTTSAEIYMWLRESGLPNEVTIRLHELLTFTRKVAGRVISVGKVILIKIIEFVKAHPFLVTSAGIGAVVGVAITGMITSIPFVGLILAPVAIALGIVITMAGAVVGHNLDNRFPTVGKDIFEIAEDFFALFTDVFNTIFRNVVIA
ncbi:MAG: hypothetical protein LH679_10540 [Cyanobacteria bacterium CAN_BIN43]|nr:hypothetical protein [Cyanobacteria bacterium CAN_BIN43]